MYSLDKETVRFKCRNSQYNSILTRVIGNSTLNDFFGYE